jgi:LacI family transcriptional regulator
MGTNTGNYFDGREQGWLQALTEAGLPEGRIVRSPFTRDGGYTAGRRLLASANRPTAIFASSDMQAAGIPRAVHEAGLSIPDDIALASFDGSAEAEYSWPPLTTVRQPAQAMAEAAVSALIGAHRGREPEHLIFPTELQVRRSCGCPDPRLTMVAAVMVSHDCPPAGTQRAYAPSLLPGEQGRGLSGVSRLIGNGETSVG